MGYASRVFCRQVNPSRFDRPRRLEAALTACKITTPFPLCAESDHKRSLDGTSRRTANGLMHDNKFGDVQRTNLA